MEFNNKAKDYDSWKAGKEAVKAAEKILRSSNPHRPLINKLRSSVEDKITQVDSSCRDFVNFYLSAAVKPILYIQTLRRYNKGAAAIGISIATTTLPFAMAWARYDGKSILTAVIPSLVTIFAQGVVTHNMREDFLRKQAHKNFYKR